MSKDRQTLEELRVEEDRFNRLATRRNIVGKLLHGDEWAVGHDYDEYEEKLLALAELLPNPDDIIIRKDGDMYMAVRGDFVNLQESPAYFAETEIIALSNLLAQLSTNNNTEESR